MCLQEYLKQLDAEIVAAGREVNTMTDGSGQAAVTWQTLHLLRAKRHKVAHELHEQGGTSCVPRLHPQHSRGGRMSLSVVSFQHELHMMDANLACMTMLYDS